MWITPCWEICSTGFCKVYCSVFEMASASCLQGELDELEREEFFRLKKVQNKKQKNVPVRVPSPQPLQLMGCKISAVSVYIAQHYRTCL